MNTPQTIELNDAFDFPLMGCRLIEASAGTGKTYTIANLYVRLLLGEGVGEGEGDVHTGFGRSLAVEQILLVTFTEAATQELKARIRRRIHQAKQAFLRPQMQPSFDADPFIEKLVRAFPVSDYPALALKLDWAEKQMDKAAIFTIHGFCQRMLKQNAFESGLLFDMALIKDETSLVEMACFDFWRDTFYPLTEQAMAVIYHHWPTPQEFLASIKPAIERDHLQLIPEDNYPDSSLVPLLDDWLKALAMFKNNWRVARDEIEKIIQNSGVKKTIYSKKSVPNWMSQFDIFCTDTAYRDFPDCFNRFSQSELEKNTEKGQVPCHAIFNEIEALIVRAPHIKTSIQHRGIASIRQRIKTLKTQQQVFGFGDLLTRFDEALHGDSGDALAARIRQLFPVAMIDEFQDTDLTQYRIFRKIYFNNEQTGLFVIGDPKQAIYSFRNADIFTYLRAKNDIHHHYHLNTNWRSTRAMVDAVNSLFGSTDNPFINKTAIPFLKVHAGGKADDSMLSDQTNTQKNPSSQAALQFFFLDGDQAYSKKEYQRCLAESCANEISRLLRAGHEKQILIGERPLEFKDIAVLVRDFTEANLIQSCLQARQIDSVFLSNRDSIFATDEARDLYLFLRAVTQFSCASSAANAAPSVNETSIRSALATRLFDYTQDELEQLFFEETHWAAIFEEFNHYQQVWQRQGVLSMLYHLFHQRDLLQRVSRSQQHERRLTNIMHLAELLQAAASELPGEKELLAWFEAQLISVNERNDDQLLRLDSDRNRVQIVTIHKSKGLEYSMVFIPFACGYRETKSPLFYDEKTQYNTFDLLIRDEYKQLADNERLAEDMRLLYVALTRSRYRCYVGVADVRFGNSKESKLDKTALGYLLLNGGTNSSLDSKLHALAQENASIYVHTLPAEPDSPVRFPLQNVDGTALFAREFKGTISQQWRISSFTSLTQGQKFQLIDTNKRLDLDALQDVLSSSSPTDERNRFTFPRGAQAGSVLHSLFEEIDFTSVTESALAKLVQQKLLLAGFDAIWSNTLVDLIFDVLAAPLLVPGAQNSIPLSLNLIPTHKRFVELEFTLPTALLKNTRLQVLEQMLIPEVTFPGLEFSPQQGYIKGFIDLVFEWQGQFFVLDYKSNYLGERVEDYQAERLTRVMAEHHYTLQYLLYSVALHRYLQQRLPHYEYNTHFGGVFYLFVRGMRHDLPGNGVYFHKPDQALIQKFDATCRGEV